LTEQGCASPMVDPSLLVAGGARSKRRLNRPTVGLLSTRCRPISGYVAGRPGDDWKDRDRVLRLTSLSFAHPEVLSDRRAQLSLPGTVLQHAHRRLGSTGHQAFLMSTCLRVEIAWAAGPETMSDLLECLYGDESFSGLGKVRTDEAAFVHLCRVAAGLESPLIGEPEVLGQFRQAVSVCLEASGASGSLRRALEAAIGIGRTTRRVLGDAPRGSLAALAASAVAPFPRVAILGAGAMARAAAEQLDGVELTIFARRPGRVAGYETLGWDAASEALATYPAVISTVPGKVPLFTDETTSRAFARRSEPMVLIDLGMPPGFSRPDPGDAVSYFGVDDLASSVNSRPSAQAEESVLKGAAAAWRRLSAPDRVGAVIAAMVEQAETAVTEEVQRFAKRLSGAEDPERVMRQLAHTVARRLLHPPISFITSTERGVDAVEVLAEAFGIDND
jgi:glutamyl-tRNA reductase